MPPWGGCTATTHSSRSGQEDPEARERRSYPEPHVVPSLHRGHLFRKLADQVHLKEDVGLRCDVTGKTPCTKIRNWSLGLLMLVLYLVDQGPQGLLWVLSRSALGPLCHPGHLQRKAT